MRREMHGLLWFDVEKGYITTGEQYNHFVLELWFDVEKGYITTGV